jgi:hypothetical protein
MEHFSSLLRLTDEELEQLGVRRMVAETKPGYPCRVSLVDAEVGEEVLLLPFTHHDVNSPYRGSGPIFVRTNAITAKLEVNEVPAMIRNRFLSIRAYDKTAMMLAADAVEGRDLEEHLSKLFSDQRVEYIHLHNARPGCFNCRVDRV